MGADRQAGHGDASRQESREDRRRVAVRLANMYWTAASWLSPGRSPAAAVAVLGDLCGARGVGIRR